MTKIVINESIGGFELSHAAIMAYAAKIELDLNFKVTRGTDPHDLDSMVSYYTGDSPDSNPFFGNFHGIKRDDKNLIAVVEKLGDKAGKDCSLIIIEVPDDVKWHLNDNDAGVEWVAEDHRTWP